MAAPSDPTKPCVPISYPITDLETLLSRSYFDSFHCPFNVSSVPLPAASVEKPPRRRILVCHDFKGGYTDDDKWVQGGTNAGAYAIWHWHLMDVFIYFSHHLVTLPPPGWTNAAHTHGVKVLGTFIAEWEKGREICNSLLSTTESARTYAERLTELADVLGFDGWLLNMEVSLDSHQIPNLKEFIGHLTQTMHNVVPGSLVIWYDSVTVDGELKYQNQLNEKNKPFFDICDGIFCNYSWKENYPHDSGTVAGNRRFDVYMGIDVWGRGTFGGGQWNTNTALDVLKEHNVSAAIFGPGWVHETQQGHDFQTAQNRWWFLVEQSWDVLQRYPNRLPFYSSFDQGHGFHYSIGGFKVLDSPWNNLSLQGFQPALNFTAISEGSIQLFINITQVVLLPDALIPIGQLDIEYDIIIPSQSRQDLSLGTEWVRYESIITMNDQTLTEVRLLCYLNQPEEVHSSLSHTSQSTMIANGSPYNASLGLICFHSSEQNIEFPSSDAWVTKGESISWPSSEEGNRTVSLKITWKLKTVSSQSFVAYNIYVQKILDGGNNPDYSSTTTADFLGVVRAGMYYVSALEVPNGVTALNFIIQVCAINGISQGLDESPRYQLAVEDIM